MRKKHLIAAFALVILLCLGLGGMEAYLHLIGYASPPHNLLLDGTPTHGNPYADRNRYPDDPFSDETFNIVIFGGAWAFALGCTNEESFAGIIEAELRDTRRLAVRVVNMGQPDFSSRDIADMFSRSVKRYKADIAVVMTGLRDCIPDYLEGNFSARKPFSIDIDTSQSKWRLNRLLANRNLAKELNKRDIDPEQRKDYVVRRLNLAETQTALLEIGRAAHEAEVKTIFITYPKMDHSDWMYPHYPLYSRRNFLIKATASNFRQMLVDLEKNIPTEKTT